MKLAISFLAVLLPHSCLAQDPGPMPTFDVASVRPSSQAGNGDEVHVETSPGSLTIRGASLRFYIEWAYHTPPFQVAGPTWLSDEGFDILAKAAMPVNNDQLRLMLRTLLAGRFGLQVHTGRKEMEVYALTLAKGGPKFHESTIEGSPSFGNDGKAAMTAKHVSMSDFAAKISEPLGRPVVDATGLKGLYDLQIDVTSYMTAAMDKGGELETMSLLFNAFERQLGLKLVARKSTVDILVVDHAEKAMAEDLPAPTAGAAPAPPAAAASKNPLVGTWHNITQPKFPQAVLLIGEDGYFSQIAISPSRTKPQHDFDHRTKMELAKQFGGFRASYGTWKIVGSKLVRTVIASEEPGAEGTETAQVFRFDGELLVLGGPQNESRFRRMK